MTTNQTIDGVLREAVAALEKAIDVLRAIIRDKAAGVHYASAQAACHQINGALDELRVMLDAPASVESLVGRTGGGMVWHECAVCHTNGSYHPDVKWCICGRVFEMTAAQPQGEPVGYVIPGDMPAHSGYTKTVNPVSEGKYTVPLYAEQPAPVAVLLHERSPKDYAIEHAEYMAKSADGVLAKFQAYGLALLAVDEGGDDGEGELFENIDSTRGDLQEALVDLRSMVYEFRKRSAKSR